MEEVNGAANVDKTASHQYDVFISYRSSDQNWVELLAKNLESQGYKVFLDIWCLKPGDDLVVELDKAIRQSRCGLLLATLDSSQSGWVQKEFALMTSFSVKSDFYFIPMLQGEFPDFPFLDTVLGVDFGNSSASEYSEAFYRLVCGIERVEPHNNDIRIKLLEFPFPDHPIAKANSNDETPFLEQAFTVLNLGQPLIVLTQEDVNTRLIIQGLKDQAALHYGEPNILHIFPPASMEADEKAYFGRLAKQCDFNCEIGSNWEWGDALAERLLQSDELFLLVTSFENGAEALRAGFARELRGLHERYPQLHLVIIGSKGLASLKYAAGDMSLLNSAGDLFAPELDVLQFRQQARVPNIDDVSDDELQQILNFIGGHPRCAHYCLQQKAISAESCDKTLRSSVLPSQLFTRFRGTEYRNRICGLLEKKEVGRFDPWPEDEVTRLLFWANLLVQDEDKLVWRSEFIRIMGKIHLSGTE